MSERETRTVFVFLKKHDRVCSCHRLGSRKTNVPPLMVSGSRPPRHRHSNFTPILPNENRDSHTTGDDSHVTYYTQKDIYSCRYIRLALVYCDNFWGSIKVVKWYTINSIRAQLLAWTNLEPEITFHVAFVLGTTKGVPSVGNLRAWKAFLMLSTCSMSQTCRQKFQERERSTTPAATGTMRYDSTLFRQKKVTLRLL
jgi:hypothetical protein